MILRKDESLRNEILMVFPMKSLHLLNILTHAILSSDLISSWKVIDSLELIHLWKEALLQITRGPTNSPVRIFDFSKSIIFKSISNYLDISVVKFEVVSLVWRLVRLQIHRVDVRSENKILL